MFEYAGQNTATVRISVNDGEPIENEIIYGTIKGLKIDRETGENIAGTLFGLFSNNETKFTEETAILTAESNEGGIFEFTDVPYGEYIVRELKPAEGYLPNEENYTVTISENKEIIEITIENDKIPELGTTATIDGKRNSQLTVILPLTMLFPTNISQQEKNTQSKASLWINPRVSNSLLTAKKFVPK